MESVTLIINNNNDALRVHFGARLAIPLLFQHLYVSFKDQGYLDDQKLPFKAFADGNSFERGKTN